VSWEKRGGEGKKGGRKARRGKSPGEAKEKVSFQKR